MQCLDTVFQSHSAVVKLSSVVDSSQEKGQQVALTILCVTVL